MTLRLELLPEDGPTPTSWLASPAQRFRAQRALSRWIDVPWVVHTPNPPPQWVPPLRIQQRHLLDQQRNPIWKRMDRALFLAHRDGEVVGRVAAIENRGHNEVHGDRVGFFGFFECRDDPEAARLLLDGAESWLAGRGLTAMRGPTSPSMNQECGLLVRGFRHHPMILTTWNPPYYEALLEGWGLERVHDLLAFPFLLAQRFDLPEIYYRQGERARRDLGITFRDIRVGNVDSEIDTLWTIYNEAWEPNWGFVPMTREEFRALARDFAPMAIPQFTFVAEVEGEPAGFMLILPDYHQVQKRIPSGRLLPTGLVKLMMGKRRLRTGRVVAMGVRRRFRTRGIFPLFATEAMRRAKEYGALGAEASWILADNEAMIRPLRRIGLKAYRQWRLYEKPIEPDRTGR
ncbi:MAG: GNAT family N-acetyltransferase [Gemmatimonadota bacterium]